MELINMVGLILVCSATIVGFGSLVTSSKPHTVDLASKDCEEEHIKIAA